VPIAEIDPALAEVDDWELFVALHRHEQRWAGLVTNDEALLSLPKEMTVLSQTHLTLVVAAGEGIRSRKENRPRVGAWSVSFAGSSRITSPRPSARRRADTSRHRARSGAPPGAIGHGRGDFRLSRASPDRRLRKRILPTA